MVFLPVKPLEPFEHVHEGKNKWFKCRPEFYDVLFYDMKQKYFVSDIIRLDQSDFVSQWTGGKKKGGKSEKARREALHE